MVARENEDVLGIVILQELNVLVDGVCGALVPLGLFALVRRQNVDAAAQAVEVPRLAGTDVSVEHMRLVLGQHADSINAGVDAVGKREVDNTVLTAERYGRLSDLFGQHIQTAAAAACEQHGYAFFFPIHVNSPFSQFASLRSIRRLAYPLCVSLFADLRLFQALICFIGQYRIIEQERFTSKFCVLIRRGFAAILSHCKKAQRHQNIKFP